MTLKVSERKWLFLRVETKARELYGKFLLALYAAERGWGVVLGNKTATRSNRRVLPKGVFMEKSIPPLSHPMIEDQRALGHRSSGWCEEGLMYFSPKDYVTRRIDEGSFDGLDYFFAWGEKQKKDMVSVLGRGQEKIIVSGNPRFDILRPEFRGIFGSQAQKLRQRYGRIILINGSFVAVNNGRPMAGDFVGYLKSLGRIKDEAHEALWRRHVKLTEKVFPYFLELPRLLSQAFPSHTIIVRPHPSEGEAIWREKTRGLSNVEVVYEGSADEWILAADVTIENNCTTAVEATILGKPVVSYRPHEDEEVEFPLSNGVSFHARTAEELLTLARHFIEKGMAGKEEAHRKHIDFAKRYIENIEGKPSCETIVDALDTLELPKSPHAFTVKTTPAWLKQLKKVKRFLIPPKDYQYHKRRFPGIELSEMHKLLAEFRESAGMFKKVEVAEVSDNGFCVYKP